MSVTAYPTLRLKLTMPQALKLQFLPAIPGSNAAAAAAAAQAAAAEAIAAANTAVTATTNKVDRTGDAMTGFLTLNADPTASLHAATKHYVDVLGTSGILEAPNDGVLYGRQSLAWAAAQPLDGNLTSLAAATATNAIYYRSAANTWATVTIGANLTFTGGTLAATGGGGGGAPTTAEYITASADATLSAERVLTNTASITWDFSTPGQAKANTAAGGGNVSNSGTPSAGQYGKWVTATTIQGVVVGTVLTDIGAQPLDATLTSLAAYNTNGLLTQTAADTFTGRTLTGPAAGLSVSNGNGVSGNPTLALANDLAALEALAGTNNIYYRAGADTWSSVTIGTGLTFTGGTLTATGGGGTGNVTYTASSTAPVSPAAGDLWYDLSTGVLSIYVNDGTSSQWVMVAPPGSGTLVAAPQCGRLEYVSATALSFKPFNGNLIKINGSMLVIPNAGIAGLANTSVFVNGTAGQNLAASTVYWVFAFSNSGTVTADFRTAATHATSTTAGNEGVEILTGNDTRSLIGMCRTNASSQFVFNNSVNYVSSWFNRKQIGARSAAVGSFSTASTSYVEISTAQRVEFLNWAGEAVFVAVSMYAAATTASFATFATPIMDSTTTIAIVAFAAVNANFAANNSTFAVLNPAEGYHWANTAVRIDGGAGGNFSEIWVNAIYQG